jgi:hypothetical protein
MGWSAFCTRRSSAAHRRSSGFPQACETWSVPRTSPPLRCASHHPPTISVPIPDGSAFARGQGAREQQRAMYTLTQRLPPFPAGPALQAILYSGDVRSFVNPSVRNATATVVVQPLLEAGCVAYGRQ